MARQWYRASLAANAWRSEISNVGFGWREHTDGDDGGGGADTIDGGADFPIFEATFRHEGVLIRADVLIPDGGGWHVIEVTASTSVQDYHVLDCAILDWVLRISGLNVLSLSLSPCH